MYIRHISTNIYIYVKLDTSVDTSHNQSESKRLKTPNHLFLETPEDISFFFDNPTNKQPPQPPQPQTHAATRIQWKETYQGICPFMQICHQRCTRYSHDILGRQLGFVTGGSVGFPHRSLVFFGWICINCLFKKCGFLSRFVCYRSHRPKGTMQVETRNFLVSWVFSFVSFFC